MLGLWAGGWWAWPCLIFVPLFASIAHQLVEVVVWQYVEHKRRLTRWRKELMVNQTITAPMAEWLTQWPATGGSAYERLQLTLRRVPDLIKALETQASLRLPVASGGS